MVSTCGSGERSRFWEPALGMEMGTTNGAEVGSRENDDSKSEEYFFRETIWMGSSGVCFGGSGEVSLSVDLLGVYGGAEIGSTIGISYGNIYGKLEGYPLGEWTFGSETIIEVSSSVGILYVII